MKTEKTIYSEILGENRSVLIYENTSPSTAERETGGRTGLLILDGEDLFTPLLEVIGQRAEPEKHSLVVVGTGNKESRVRDFTPTAVEEAPFINKEKVDTTGGGDLFISHLQNELLPFLHSLYPDCMEWAILGHSLGGLEVINILLKKPELFEFYISIEPSLWYDNHVLLDEAKWVLAGARNRPVNFFLAVADSAGKHLSVPEIREDDSKKGELIKPNIEFADYLKGLKNINFKWKYYPDHNHFSVLPVAIEDALNWLFENTGVKKK